MGTTLPYLTSYKNVDRFFEGLSAAKTPEAVTQRFLQETLGLKSAGDRPLIPLLRQLGFIDSAGKPTPTYNALKNASKVRVAMGDAIRQAYKPLFDANEHADQLTPDELKGLVAQVAGSDKDMTSKILGTLNALRRRADFAPAKIETKDDGSQTEDDHAGLGADGASKGKGLKSHTMSDGSAEFHFNIQVHLPANATEEVYVSIFAAIRQVFS